MILTYTLSGIWLPALILCYCVMVTDVVEFHLWPKPVALYHREISLEMIQCKITLNFDHTTYAKPCCTVICSHMFLTRGQWDISNLAVAHCLKGDRGCVLFPVCILLIRMCCIDRPRTSLVSVTLCHMYTLTLPFLWIGRYSFTWVHCIIRFMYHCKPVIRGPQRHRVE